MSAGSIVADTTWPALKPSCAWVTVHHSDARCTKAGGGKEAALSATMVDISLNPDRLPVRVLSSIAACRAAASSGALSELAAPAPNWNSDGNGCSGRVDHPWIGSGTNSAPGSRGGWNTEQATFSPL